jgi:ADP-ribose pyrophosphatase
MHAELKEIVPVYEGKFIKYYNFILSDGRNYEVVSRKNLTIDSIKDSNDADAVDIIAFNEDCSKILVIKEWRVPVNNYIYAFPAGLREPGEEILETASRELFEETGLKITSVVDILPPSYQSAGMTDEKVATVICHATGEITNEYKTKDEDIIPIWVTRDEARKTVVLEPISGRCQMVLSAWAWDAFYGRI